MGATLENKAIPAPITAPFGIAKLDVDLENCCPVAGCTESVGGPDGSCRYHGEAEKCAECSSWTEEDGTTYSRGYGGHLCGVCQ